jgi:hypothetical protein
MVLKLKSVIPCKGKLRGVGKWERQDGLRENE